MCGFIFPVGIGVLLYLCFRLKLNKTFKLIFFNSLSITQLILSFGIFEVDGSFKIKEYFKRVLISPISGLIVCIILFVVIKLLKSPEKKKTILIFYIIAYHMALFAMLISGLISPMKGIVIVGPVIVLIGMLIGIIVSFAVKFPKKLTDTIENSKYLKFLNKLI